MVNVMDVATGGINAVILSTKPLLSDGWLDDEEYIKHEYKEKARLQPKHQVLPGSFLPRE